MKKLLGIFLIVTACCNNEELNTLRDARNHAEKIRNHFMGHVSEDVSTLIAKTRGISYRLKSLKFYGLANKFDSYTDVLIYGNDTIQESVKDMQDLVRGGVCACDYKLCIECPSSE